MTEHLNVRDSGDGPVLVLLHANDQEERQGNANGAVAADVLCGTLT